MSNSFDVLNELSEEDDFVATTSNSFGDCVDDYDDDEVHLPDDTRKNEEIHYFDREDTEVADLAQVVKEVEHGNG
ncbi:hypothetical protein Tco_0980752 [Tanacetum coccineum]